MSELTYYVYMLSNSHRNVLYIGVTRDLVRRVYEHKSKSVKGFTYKYNLNCLVYYEIHNDIYTALTREKELKGWKRFKKDDLIAVQNPQWNDLWGEICG